MDGDHELRGTCRNLDSLCCYLRNVHCTLLVKDIYVRIFARISQYSDNHVLFDLLY